MPPGQGCRRLLEHCVRFGVLGALLERVQAPRQRVRDVPVRVLGGNHHQLRTHHRESESQQVLRGFSAFRKAGIQMLADDSGIQVLADDSAAHGIEKKRRDTGRVPSSGTQGSQ